MENQTRNLVITICTILITVTVCFALINNSLNENKVVNGIEKTIDGINEFNGKPLNINTNNFRMLNSEIKVQLKQIQSQKRAITTLKRKISYYESKFAKQIESEKNKANIIWSDKSLKPKYNQIQEGIQWSKKK